MVENVEYGLAEPAKVEAEYCMPLGDARRCLVFIIECYCHVTTGRHYHLYSFSPSVSSRLRRDQSYVLPVCERLTQEVGAKLRKGRTSFQSRDIYSNSGGIQM